MNLAYIRSCFLGRPISSACLLLSLYLLLLNQISFAQESYLVSTTDGVVSMYDLATNTLVASTKLSGNSFNMVPVPNPRLAFVSVLSSYYSVVDTTLDREVTRIKGVHASSGTMTPDGSKFLAPDFSLFLNVMDPAQLKLVRRVSLRDVQSPKGLPGQIAATNARAYVFPRNQSIPQIAVVDLTTYAVSGIPLPTGSICRKCGGITPDGSTLVVLDRERSDGNLHVVLVSTATNTIIADKAQPDVSYANGLVVTPNGADPTKIYGYVVGSLGQRNLGILDLVTNSPTYGTILPQTEVSVYLTPEEMAINSDGSRLIIVGSPELSHNVEVFDTGKLFSDPNNALIANVNVEPGTQVTSVCIGSFSTTIPNSAPVVTGVSGDVTNGAPHDIQVIGGNFRSGAWVRIGSMDPLPATFLGSDKLSVTVPAASPAGRALDIVVTNPQTNDPPDQQNQSGLLAGSFNILLDPKFQPHTQFATVNADNSFSVYDPVQRAMVNNQGANLGDYFYYPVFNVDGKELYISQQQFSWTDTCCGVLPVNLANNNIESSIPITSSQSISIQEGLAARRNPSTGKPVIDVMWADNNDLHVSLIDSDSGSPTYHTIIKTFDAGLSLDYVYSYVMTVSPDGNFAYLWYDDDVTSNLGVMNLTTGAFTTFTCDALGVYWLQQQIYVSPDGQSLLLMSYKSNRARVKIFSISDPMHPKPVIELTPIPVPGRGFPYVANYQVVGDKLYTMDSSGVIVVFNFNTSTGDFRERGYYVLDPLSVIWGFTFSFDGAYLYLADGVNDQLLVMDTSKLVAGQAALITTLRSPYAPEAMNVSPVPPPSRLAATAGRGMGQHGGIALATPVRGGQH